MTAPLLHVAGLTCSYGPIRALTDVSLTVAGGEAVAVVGANGAGKSTLINAVCRTVRVATGSITVDGQDTLSLTPWAVARRGVVQVPEGRRCFAGLTVTENLVAGASGAPRREMNRRLTEIMDSFPMLSAKAGQQATQLSGGQQQLVAIGRSLMADPRLLLIDEASLGLSPVAVEEVVTHLREIQQSRGLALLVVDQGLGLPSALCTRGYVMKQGRMAGEGPMDEIEPLARAAYLS